MGKGDKGTIGIMKKLVYRVEEERYMSVFLDSDCGTDWKEQCALRSGMCVNKIFVETN